MTVYEQAREALDRAEWKADADEARRVGGLRGARTRIARARPSIAAAPRQLEASLEARKARSLEARKAREARKVAAKRKYRAENRVAYNRARRIAYHHPEGAAR